MPGTLPECVSGVHSKRSRGRLRDGGPGEVAEIWRTGYMPVFGIRDACRVLVIEVELLVMYEVDDFYDREDCL